MKRYIRAATDNSAEIESLQGLAEDLLYQCWDNYRWDNVTLRQAKQIVWEHAELVITELDDDKTYGYWGEMATKTPSKFKREAKRIVNQVVDQHYPDYDWD